MLIHHYLSNLNKSIHPFIIAIFFPLTKINKIQRLSQNIGIKR